jgi:hypothetical protein
LVGVFGGLFGGVGAEADADALFGSAFFLVGDVA